MFIKNLRTLSQKGLFGNAKMSKKFSFLMKKIGIFN